MQKWGNTRAVKLVAGEQLQKEPEDSEQYDKMLKGSQRAMMQAKKKVLKHKSRMKSNKKERREEEIEYTTEEEIFLPKPISRNCQLSFNNSGK